MFFPAAVQVKATRGGFASCSGTRVACHPWLPASPQAALREVTLLRSPWPLLRAACPEHPLQGAPFPGSPACCGAAGKQAGPEASRNPLPEPPTPLPAVGKGSPHVSMQLAAAGLQPGNSPEKGKGRGRSARRLSPTPQGRAPHGRRSVAPGCCRGLTEPGSGKEEWKEPALTDSGRGRGELSAWHPSHGHLHQQQQHPSIPLLPPDPRQLPVPSCLIDTFQGMFDGRSSGVSSTGAGPIYQAFSRCQGRGRKQMIYRFN